LSYDVVLKNVRVMDPRNHFDGITDIGIADGKIASVGGGVECAGQAVIDLSGKTAVPGVIDLHTHLARSDLKEAPFIDMARGGTVTALELSGPPEVVFDNVARYGTGMNVAVLNTAVPGRSLAGRKAGTAEIAAFVEKSLVGGSYGVKILGGHYPFEPDTTHDIIRQTNKAKAYVAYHVGTTATGSNLLGIKEAVEMSRDCHMQVCHVNGALRGHILGDRLLEVREAMAAISSATNIVSESLLSEMSSDGARCVDGLPASMVVRASLKLMGFAPTQDGLREAIAGGPVRVIVLREGQLVLIGGKEAAEAWEKAGTNISMVSPLNPRDLALICATYKDKDGRFIVDAIASDAGGCPRNVNVTYGLALVRFGALTLEELVVKVADNPARILGLANKGHLGKGADADITFLDLDKGVPCMSMVCGKVIMKDGEVLGKKGTVITTPAGQEAVRKTGLDCIVNEPEKGWLYTPKPDRYGVQAAGS